MFKGGKSEGLEDTEIEKTKGLGAWWLEIPPFTSKDNQMTSLQPDLRFSDPRTESFHGLGVRSSSSSSWSKTKSESEFTIKCLVLVICLFNINVQLWIQVFKDRNLKPLMPSFIIMARTRVQQCCPTSLVAHFQMKASAFFVRLSLSRCEIHNPEEQIQIGNEGFFKWRPQLSPEEK